MQELDNIVVVCGIATLLLSFVGLLYAHHCAGLKEALVKRKRRGSSDLSAGFDACPSGLECPVELTSYTEEGDAKPYVLPCGHTVSRRALQKLLKASRPCPFDRRMLSSSKLSSYRPNYELLAALRVIRKLSESSQIVSSDAAAATTCSGQSVPAPGRPIAESSAGAAPQQCGPCSPHPKVPEHPSWTVSTTASVPPTSARTADQTESEGDTQTTITTTTTTTTRATATTATSSSTTTDARQQHQQDSKADGSSKHLQQLVEMGFGSGAARAALAHTNGTVTAAVELLLRGTAAAQAVYCGLLAA
eukprot:TRINITY_DN9161_c0_g1_i1.p1 TRINITY_DN9161_c0_g1~~TRINITY_DN9161_c0_g1_i1.p1  ORF type:complete len:305 (-),score=31.11 TRINITY_DN9161_c0_g1_i1:383-1297(-)